MTLIGPLTYTRDYVFCRLHKYGAGKGDSMLYIDKDHLLSKGLIDVVTYAGQLLPFNEAETVIKKFYGYTGVEVSTTTIRKVCEEVGKKLYDKNLEKATEVYNSSYKIEVSEDTEVKGDLYILLDGSQVNTIDKNKEGSTWKEMKIGEIFNSKDIVYRKNGDAIIVNKEYFTHLGSVETFKKIMFNALVEANYLSYKRIIVIADGAKWIWNMVNELCPNAIEILDFYHLVENINTFAKAVYPNNEVQRKQLVNTITDYVKYGNEDKALESIKKIKFHSEKLPKGTINLLEYMENNKDRIKYKKFKESGFYIGSGPIESANKTVIQQRMKQSGMRWSVDGAQYIATLRAKYKSKKWDDVLKVI